MVPLSDVHQFEGGATYRPTPARATPATRRGRATSWVRPSGAVTFNNKTYGMPVGGTQPVFFFYNKALMAKYHLQLPDYHHAADQ